MPRDISSRSNSIDRPSNPIKPNQEQLEVKLEQLTCVLNIVRNIRRSLDLQSILSTTTIEVRQLLEVDRVAVFQFEPTAGQTDGKFVAEDVAQGFPPAVAVSRHDRCFGQESAHRHQNGEVLAVADIYTADLSDCHIQSLEQFQVRANLAVPVLDGDRLWGLLCVHQCTQPRSWQSHEIEFVQYVAEHLAIAIQQSERLTQTQQQLAQLRQAEEEQRRSQRALSLLIQQNPMAIIQLDPSLRITDWNPAAERIFGYHKSEVLGRYTLEVTQPKNEKTQISQTLDDLLDGNFSSHYSVNENYTKDGRTIICEWYNLTLIDEEGAIIGVVAMAQDISDRIQAESDRQASERRYQTLTETSPVGIFRTNAIGECLYVNPCWCEIAGLTPEQAMGNGWVNALHPEDKQRVMTEWMIAAQHDRPFHSECRFQQPTGQVFWLVGQAVAERDAVGTLLGYVGTITNIADRKAAEAALQTSEARFQTIAANIPGTIYQYVVRDDGTDAFTYISPRCRTIFELDPAAVMADSRAMWEVVHPDDISLMQSSILKAAQALQPWSMEYRITTQSGQLKWCRASSTPRLQPNGDLLWDGLILDISDRKAVEALLTEREQFLTSIYNGVEYILFVVDVCQDGEFRYAGWNPACEAATGMSSQMVCGKTPEEVFPPDAAADFRQRYQACLSSDRTVTYENSAEFGGEVVWFMVTLNPLRDTRDRIYRIVGTSTDITERKQAEHALQRNAQELQHTLQELQRTQSQLIQSEKMSSLGQLVAGVAHEINNPVSFIYGNINPASEYIEDLLNLIQLYQKHYPNPIARIQDEIEAIDLDFVMEDLPKLLTSIRMGADRIRKIVLSLRTFSRMDEAECKAVDLHEGIDSTLLILENRLKAQHNRPAIEVMKHYETLPPIECYAGQLNQVFMNILVNAIDAIDEITKSSHASRTNSLSKTKVTPVPPSIQITTELIPSTSAHPSRVRIKIADNGPGIPKSVRQRLFDPFFTTKPVGKGTGMGLSISYQIVTERHGGILKCTSASGQGATFTIEIPIQQSEDVNLKP